MKIFDTSSIIGIISEAKCPYVFENCVERGYKLNIPNTVYEELKRNQKTYEIFKEHEKYFKVLDLDINSVNKILKRYPNLHKGEAGVICSAMEYENSDKKYICIVDDSGAREFCDNQNINMVGLIGFLKWQKRINDISEGESENIYKRLKRSGFRIKEDILRELIK